MNKNDIPACELSKKIENMKNEFYSNNKKPVLFKAAAKSQIYSIISSEIGLVSLLSRSVFVIPNTNKIFFDYTIFKQYANPDNYLQIISFICDKIKSNVTTYGHYEVLTNLDTFSISACHRYKDVIQLFCEHCLNTNSEYSNELKTMYIYNTPYMFQQIAIILKPHVNPTILEKLVLINKADSGAVIQSIYESVGIQKN